MRALSRDPGAPRAKRLGLAGVEWVEADLDDPASLAPTFVGAHGVFSVQNFHEHGAEKEIRMGKNVADAAKAAGVKHLVQASAGTGAKGTGIPSWETKLVIEAHVRAIGVPMTVLRPMAFMELITDKTFFPHASTFHVMPQLLGDQTPVPWISTDDIGAITARVFADPEHFVGRSIPLCSDVQSIEQVRAIYLETFGKKPRRFRMPLFMFRFFTGEDLIRTYTWLAKAPLPATPDATREILPEASSLRSWLARQAT